MELHHSRLVWEAQEVSSESNIEKRATYIHIYGQV